LRVLCTTSSAATTNLASEGRRVLFTLAGVGIAVIVLLLASLLQKRSTQPAPQAQQVGTA
jgi:hypothetical protein